MDISVEGGVGDPYLLGSSPIFDNTYPEGTWRALHLCIVSAHVLPSGWTDAPLETLQEVASGPPIIYHNVHTSVMDDPSPSPHYYSGLIIFIQDLCNRNPTWRGSVKEVVKVCRCLMGSLAS